MHTYALNTARPRKRLCGLQAVEMNEEQEGDFFLTTLQPMNGVNQLESEKFIF